MATSAPDSGTRCRLRTPSAWAKSLCSSQYSPSRVGVVSVSSGSCPWKRMPRSLCRNFSASSPTPGNGFWLKRSVSAQRMCQSERTKTTEPSGTRPCSASHSSTSETWRW